MIITMKHTVLINIINVSQYLILDTSQMQIITRIIKKNSN